MRECRPSRTAAQDEIAARRVAEERKYLIQQANAMKQQEEAKQTAEIESQEETNRQRIVAQASAMHARLEQEALQLEEALHADMHRKHEMVRTWFEAAMRKCADKQAKRQNAPREVTRPVPRKPTLTPRSSGFVENGHDAMTPRSVANVKASFAQALGRVGSGMTTSTSQDMPSCTPPADDLSQVRMRLRDIFSDIFRAFVFLDINDNGFLGDLSQVVFGRAFFEDITSRLIFYCLSWALCAKRSSVSQLGASQCALHGFVC